MFPSPIAQNCWQRAIYCFSVSKQVWEREPRKYLCLTLREIRAIDRKFQEIHEIINNFSFELRHLIILLNKTNQLQILLLESDVKFNRLT